MTSAKITGTPTSAAREGLAPHVDVLFAIPGKRVMAVVELAHFERVQPAPGSDSDAVVRLKLTQLEIPTDDQEHILRNVQRALFLARTARGTFDEDGQLQLDDLTLKTAAGDLNLLETARLRAGLAHWSSYTSRIVTQSQDFSPTEIAHELKHVADGLSAVLNPSATQDGE